MDSLTRGRESTLSVWLITGYSFTRYNIKKPIESQRIWGTKQGRAEFALVLAACTVDQKK